MSTCETTSKVFCCAIILTPLETINHLRPKICSSINLHIRPHIHNAAGASLGKDSGRTGSPAAFIAVATGYLPATWKLTPTNPEYLVSIQMIFPYAQHPDLYSSARGDFTIINSLHRQSQLKADATHLRHSLCLWILY